MRYVEYMNSVQNSILPMAYYHKFDVYSYYLKSMGEIERKSEYNKYTQHGGKKKYDDFKKKIRNIKNRKLGRV